MADTGVKLTAINVLLDRRSNAALVRLSDGLGLEAVAKKRLRVHGALESIALPGKEVIGVGAVALVAVHGLAEAPDKRLGAIRGPHGLVVEGTGIPHGLERQLGHADGMRGRAGTGSDEPSAAAVVHVVLVVGAVEVFTVPAAMLVVYR